jgi:hypothetical protein
VLPYQKLSQEIKQDHKVLDLELTQILALQLNETLLMVQELHHHLIRTLEVLHSKKEANHSIDHSLLLIKENLDQLELITQQLVLHQITEHCKELLLHLLLAQSHSNLLETLPESPEMFGLELFEESLVHLYHNKLDQLRKKLEYEGSKFKVLSCYNYNEKK